MKRLATMRLLLGGFATILLLAGCGGGGGGDSLQSQAPASSGAVSVLAWTPPTSYNDNIVLDPERDLDFYEIYIRQDSNFSDSDQPVIQVAAVATTVTPDGVTVRSLVSEFNLGLIPVLPAGSQLYVSMRAVGVDQQRSRFMDPLLWDRT